MLKYAVQKNKEYLINTSGEYGPLSEAILFDTDTEAFMYARKRSAATVVRVKLSVQGVR